MNKFLRRKSDAQKDGYVSLPGYGSIRKEISSPSRFETIRQKLKIISIIILFVASGLLLFMHPFFSIRVLTIEGNNRIGESDLRETVEGILSYKKFFVLPQNNFFTMDIYDLKDILMEKYSLQKVLVTKSFPNALTIQIEEKKSKIIYDNGAQYTLLDEMGTVREVLRIVDDNEWREIKKMVSSTDETGLEIQKEEIVSRTHNPSYQKMATEVGDYPLIYDIRNKPIAKDEQILEPITVQGILEWFQYIKTQTQVPIAYFYLEQELGDVIIKTSEGWIIKAKLNQDIEKQFEALQYILNNKVQRPNLQYIDVRYIGRAYWL
jgi:hypothetical protein